MKYFPYNENLSQQITSIRKSIRLSMNGVNTGLMEQAGILYHENFGLTLPQIKVIAGKYKKNIQLANQLWSLNIRETMIMATLLMPADLIQKETFHRWMKEIKTTEMAEQFAINLACKVSFGKDIALQHLTSDNEYELVISYLTLSRLSQTLSEKETDKIIESIKAQLSCEKISIYRNAAILLRFIGRSSEMQKNRVCSFANSISNNLSIAARYIYQELNTELLYFE